MINPSTYYDQDDFNEFTETLYSRILEGKIPKVKLRNGQTVEISWFSEDGPEYEHFKGIDVFKNYLIWNNDGTSVTSRDFDMMESNDF